MLREILTRLLLEHCTLFIEHFPKKEKKFSMHNVQLLTMELNSFPEECFCFAEAIVAKDFDSGCNG
jgi:IS30 family transposase